MSDKPIPDAPTPEQVATENTTAQATADPTSEAATNIGSDAGDSTAAVGDTKVGGGATDPGTQSPALTKSATPQSNLDTPPATPNSDGSVPFATLLAASRESAAEQATADPQAAAWPRVPSASSKPSASSMPLAPMPPPLPPAPKRWQHVARPPGVLPAAALAGIVGATVIPVDRSGIGWLIAGTAITGALCAVDYRARSRGTSPERSSDSAAPTATSSGEVSPRSVSIGDRAWWAAAAIVLLGVGTVRAAGWLFVLCVIAACVAGSLAVLGRRSVRGIVHDVFAVPLATFGAVPWALSSVRESRSVGTASVRRYGVSVAATAALLVVFVPLLGGADATFAGLLTGLVPTVDGPAAWLWLFLFVVVALGVLGALYLLAGPPSRAADSVRPGRLWSRSEWMLPVGTLTVLFAVFVGAQFVALFGGDDYVQRTAGLTYAEYARSGFWQLSAVSILTLAVILAVLHWSARETAADRRSLRILLSAVSVLALVIVCSALGRMWTYQQAYGFTVLRLLVTMCELWVGLVYVLVLISIARLRWTWVPRAAIGTALATLIALAVVNPEHLVAERNIDRWHTSKRLDAHYLSGLSPDILPALDGLGDSYLRAEIEDAVREDLDDDDWWSWNWSRSAAR
ncbi:DUF4153 domain-containing protein [Nocardia sp. A7]|uniref:DUF4153 domain-containing protein n=1 Tax=Nocardia sp. A7 TaxID=2789274 RepID=UPI003979341E